MFDLKIGDLVTVGDDREALKKTYGDSWLKNWRGMVIDIKTGATSDPREDFDEVQWPSPTVIVKVHWFVCNGKTKDIQVNDCWWGVEKIKKIE